MLNYTEERFMLCFEYHINKNADRTSDGASQLSKLYICVDKFISLENW